MSFLSRATLMSSMGLTPSLPASAIRKPIGSPTSAWPRSSYRPSRTRIYSHNAAPKISENFSTAPIEVATDVKTQKIVVLGGTGFVGSAICKAAISKGMEVASLSRSGRPSYTDTWTDQVTWIAGDVFHAQWDEVLVGATAVVSTLGGFGNEDQMQKINGEANILAVGAAKDYGVPKFVLISIHDYKIHPFFLSCGFFTGKRRAESELLSKYPTSGVVLRPALIYGKRKLNGFDIPIDMIGLPLERLLLSAEMFIKPLNSLAGGADLFAPPVSVDDVAFAAINAVIDDDFFGVFTIEQIREAAAKMRP